MLNDYKSVQTGTGLRGEIHLSSYPVALPPDSIAVFMGIYIYTYLPPVMRPARFADLFFDRPGSIAACMPRIGVRYMVESFITPGHYHVYSTNADTRFGELEAWFAYGKIWVKSEK